MKSIKLVVLAALLMVSVSTMAGGLPVKDQVSRCMELLKGKNSVSCKIYTTISDKTHVFDIEKIVLRKFGVDAVKSISHEGYQGKRKVLFKDGKVTKKATLIEIPRKAGRNKTK